MPRDRESRSFAWLLLAATVVMGVAWAGLVPPFEAPDESAFYKSLMQYAFDGVPVNMPLYAAVMKPALKLAGRDSRPFQIQYNPSFRFVSNRYGRVNMFMHGRSEGALKSDIRRLYLLRALTMAMWAAALMLTFLTARLFFGRADLAFLTAVLCLSIPQLSFFSSKIHQEATVTLLASIAYFTLTARAYGRISRAPAWAVGLVVMAAAAFSDRQGFFLLLLVPFGLVATEKTWRAAAAAAAVLVVPGALLLLLPQFDRVQSDFWGTFVGSFAPSYNGGWWNPENRRYFAFEVTPKLFFGFWGWLGQPSILLPPALYAAFAVLTGVGVTGFFLKTDRLPRPIDERRTVWIFGVGFLLTLAPIIYANLFISRNSWHGRWLFPSVGPIMIALVAGFRSFITFTRRRPRAVVVALVGTAAILEGLWLTSPGEAVRTGIRGSHYGDQAHLIATIGAAIATLSLAGAVIAIATHITRQLDGRRVPLVVAAAAWTANLLLLFTFIAPLYRPLDAEGFVAAVRRETQEGELGPASQLYRIGVIAYPTSTELRRLATEIPEVLIAAHDEQMLAELQARVGRGQKIQSRAALMGLARAARTRGGVEPAMLRAILDHADDTPELAEPRALIRAALDGTSSEPSLAADVIRAGMGVHRPIKLRDEATIEGTTVHQLSSGYNEIVLYFRPLHDWPGRRIWFHCYPPETEAYLTVEAVPPAFAGWRVGELAWEVYTIPASVRYHCFAGIAVGSLMGDAYPTGPIGR